MKKQITRDLQSVNPLGRKKGNSANLRAVVNLHGMGGMGIVISMQAHQRHNAASANPGPESMQVVYADVAENPAQVYRRSFIAQCV